MNEYLPLRIRNSVGFFRLAIEPSDWSATYVVQGFFKIGRRI